uniref:Uncharacterized protein n=1 Tax=Anguilla anguilla TaxID=7936 RepID=A0A0E9PPH4_ANGAN
MWRVGSQAAGLTQAFWCECEAWVDYNRPTVAGGWKIGLVESYRTELECLDCTHCICSL